ncbi:MAG: long-chain fatty acid--CoA ligase [Pedosphaera sp. Tous-C6FEB]|nr:MAG: long-chain fatty acid--CoA ligase [Pedosphaera sp. Tous-C6FEB]
MTPLLQVTSSPSFADYARQLVALIERGEALTEAQFADLARELFALQFAHVTPYRRLCDARKVTPATLADWCTIPAVPSAAFKELELTSLAPTERTAVFHSSGTTGHQPSRHFHSAESLAVYEASLRSSFARHVVARAGDGKSSARFLCLAPPPEQAPHSSLVHMFASVSRAFGAPGSGFVASAGTDNSWALDAAAALTALRDAETSAQPLVLLGTAFMFVHLLDALAQLGLSITLPPGSCAMETGGYKGRSRELPKAELHAQITARLGLPHAAIVCEYGMSELSSQAYSSLITNHSSLPFVFPPWCRARVLSPETGREVAEGETGLLRIFDLANVRSVMALQTEDLAVRRAEGFELLGRATQAEARGCSLLAQ